MSESIFETFTDERGNISVRVSRDVQVLTHEEARHIEAEYKRMQAENAKLRELVRDYEHCSMHADCDSCKYDGTTSTHCPFSPGFPDIDELRELGVEVKE